MNYITMFIFIFLAAAPGRTTFILIMLASQGKIKNILVGGGLAFLIQSFISVLLGQLLTLLPQYIVQFAAGILFINFGYSFWKQAHAPLDIVLADREMSAKKVFWMVFVGEFGDVSQLAIAGLASQATSKASVFFVAVVALWLITGIAILVGRNLKRMVKAKSIQKFASIAFFAMGIFLIAKASILLAS